MKKLILSVLFYALISPTFSQSLGYQDIALMFSTDNNIGSARFNSMSGAFGALGGDVSAIKINPAGGSVFTNSTFSSSANSRGTDINTNYYGTSTNNSDEYFNLSQTGAVFVFNNYTNSNWSKFAFSFNFSIRNDFRNTFIANGNSGFATFNIFPLDEGSPTTLYNNADSQQFVNTYKGEISEYNFAISGIYQDNLYAGIAVNTFDINFRQQSVLKEQNNDGSGTTLNADFYQENNTIGTGFSISAGVIYKASSNLRLGFSYQTPVWFTEVIEETNITDNDGFLGDTDISISSSNTSYSNTADNYFPYQNFAYKLKTPAKATASLAYVFGSNGLISMDYSYKNYSKIKLSEADFSAENQFFADNLRNTHTINVGSEWRIKALSIRGGYHYEQSPDKNAIESDNIKGYSFGAGYKFGNTRLDFSYQNSSKTEVYDFYPQYNQVNASDISIDNRVFTATVTFSL